MKRWTGRFPRGGTALWPLALAAALWSVGVCSQEGAPTAPAPDAASQATASALTPVQATPGPAFADVEEALAQRFTDVQSIVVVLRGQTVYRYFRDGDPEALRPTHSVAKSAISALLGVAIAQGHVRSVDERVIDLMPEWATLNTDPRAQAITLRHLITFTGGFDVRDPNGTAAALPAHAAWARPMAHPPGHFFAYDNSIISMLTAVLEKRTGQALPDYARAHLVTPMGMAEPAYRQGRLALRTQDMAALGQLYLQRGEWQGRQLLPAAFVDASVHAQNTGGDPMRLSYGYLWWVVPSKAPRPTFLASGWGGQIIWVHPAMELVVAATSHASPDSARRGQVMQLVRQPVFAAVQRLQAQGGR